MKIQAVILDFDGVINDSTLKGLGRITKIVRDAGYKIPGDIDQILRKNWGVHGTKLIETCFGLDPLVSKMLYKRWEEIDATHFFPLVEGVKDALMALKYILKRKIGMLTSRNRTNLLAVLDHYCLTHLFNCIQAKDDWPFIKPDPRSFDYILEQLDIQPDQCIYVGDTPLDFECADKRGVLSISVLSGIFEKKDFLMIGQKEENIIPSISYLPKWLADQEL